VRTTLSDGTTLILDAGTGIRALDVPPNGQQIHSLLTHLHLDHIQGLLFFSPFFNPDAEIMVWGPPPEKPPLRDMLARYLSSPLSPIEIRELPARVRFCTFPLGGCSIGSATVQAARVIHRGVTLGYRIDDGDASLCYLPDHEPALGKPLASAGDQWISGLALARGTSLLIHDGQFTDELYPTHVGWGHSSIGDALRFGLRAEAKRVLLFHHDPAHTDDRLDELGKWAAEAWIAWDGEPDAVEFAQERRVLDVHAAPSLPARDFS